VKTIAFTGKIMSIKCQCCLSSLRSFGEKKGFQLVKCENCGFITTDPLPTLDEVKAVYSKQYFVKDGSEQKGFGYQDVFSIEWNEGQKQVSKLRIRIIRDLLGKQGSILDVGCANGIFLGTAIEKGWNGGGVEINQDMREVAAKICPKGEIFPSIEEASGSYDVITMWEYLEHMRQPEDTLKNVQRLLKPQGILCLSFPNIESRTSYQKKINWEHVCPPEHLHYWTERNISMFLSRFGFSVVGFRYFGLRWPLEANRKFGSRSNPKTPFWPLTTILYRLCKPFYSIPVKENVPYSIRRLYEGIEVYARYIGRTEKAGI